MLTALGHNTIIQLVGKLLATISGLIVVAFMTRSLGTEGFGHFTTVMVFLQTFGILVDFGLTMTAGRGLGEGKIESSKLLGNILSFRVTTAAIAFALAPVIAWFFPYPTIVKIGITFTSLAFFLSSLSQTFQAVFQAALKSGRLVLADIYGRVILLAGTIIVAQIGLGLNAYLVIYTAASAAIAAATLYYATKLMPFHWEIDLSVWRGLWLATWPLTVTIILNLIYLKADTLILAATWPAQHVGLYGAAYKVLEVLLAVPAIVGGLILPLAAGYYAQGLPEKLKQLYHDSFDALFAFGLAVIVGGIIVGTPIITILAGNDFKISGELLMPLSIATVLIFLSNIAGYFIFAIGKQRQIIPLYIVTAVIAFVLFMLFIPKYSYWGAAWSSVGANALMCLGSLILLVRWGLAPSIKRWLKIIMASLVLALGLLLPFNLAYKLILGLMLYTLFIWYSKLIPTNSLAVITKKGF